MLVIELADVIADLRSELDADRRQGAGEELRFELGPVALEVSVAVRKDAGGNATVKFWVGELGADGKVSSTATQPIKLTLNRLTTAAAAAEPPMSDRSPLMSGASVERER